MRRLPLSSLQAFEAASRTGSFRAAGEELGISPSAISHAVRKLELLMGSALFDRQSRAIRLNGAGEALLVHVSAAFDQMRQGVETVGARSGNLLRLHCAPSMATQWLMPRLRDLFAAQPGLEVRLAAGIDYPRFEHDEFDADICYGPPRQEGLVVIPLGEETITPLCTPELADRLRSIDDLRAAKLIESDNKRVRWAAWFEANGIGSQTPRGSRFDRSFMAIAAAVDGLGVALESTRLAERELANGMLVAPFSGHAQDVRYVGHFLVFPRVAMPRRAVRYFANWLIAELGLPPHKWS
ncbi:LysR substrate-binding domain-containing protein [Bosea sp. (in: a-proteobacteria)]|uniref:LysR substrate-binding domain-containing protein n=1 Tax=Bosea sp. (in: a-proteobacteria) TaxID=1871050 RepID=UPI003B3A3DF1